MVRPLKDTRRERGDDMSEATPRWGGASDPAKSLTRQTLKS